MQPSANRVIVLLIILKIIWDLVTLCMTCVWKEMTIDTPIMNTNLCVKNKQKTKQNKNKNTHTHTHTHTQKNIQSLKSHKEWKNDAEYHVINQPTLKWHLCSCHHDEVRWDWPKIYHAEMVSLVLYLKCFYYIERLNISLHMLSNSGYL